MRVYPGGVLLEQKDIQGDGTIAGYGSVFGVVDTYGDVIEPGAFTGSLADSRQKGRMPALLWQHNSAAPVGTWTDMHEDSSGLYVRGRLALETSAGHDAYVLVKSGALSGLSIGFSTKKARLDEKTGIRTILDVKLWEVSLVTFPANDDARVESVRAGSMTSTERAEIIRALRGFGASATAAR